MITKNAQIMRGTVENLIVLTSLEKDTRQHRHVRLPEAVREACRQVREAALAVALDIRTADDIPDVEVNAAAVELCLTNYLANSIKYVDPAKGAHFAAVSAGIEPGDGGREVVVRVRDNGLGVLAEKRDRLFERFFRAHETVSDAEGTGLGLSIVRETIESIGGRAWAEFHNDGSVFAFSMPYRRESDL